MGPDLRHIRAVCTIWTGEWLWRNRSNRTHLSHACPASSTLCFLQFLSPTLTCDLKIGNRKFPPKKQFLHFEVGQHAGNTCHPAPPAPEASHPACSVATLWTLLHALDRSCPDHRVLLYQYWCPTETYSLRNDSKAQERWCWWFYHHALL